MGKNSLKNYKTMKKFFSPLLLCIISVLLSYSLSCLLLYQHDLGVPLFEMLVGLMGEGPLSR